METEDFISTMNPLSQASCTGFHAGIVSIIVSIMSSVLRFQIILQFFQEYIRL